MFDFPSSPSNGQVYAPPGGPIYTFDGVAWVCVTDGAAGPAIIDRYYTASGTYVRPSGLLLAEVWVQAAGGGGGTVTATATQVNAGAGGGGGGLAYKLYQANQLPASVAFTVGAGGTAGAAPNNAGNPGGNSIFDVMTANGGAGGSWTGGGGTWQTWPGGNGGTATGGDLNVKGSAGATAHQGLTLAGSNRQGAAGSGGAAGCGAGGGRGAGGSAGASANGEAGANGSGGAGGFAIDSTSNYLGGAGGSGFIRVREHYGKLGSPIIASKRTVITASTNAFQYDALTLYADIEVQGGGGAGAGAGTSGAAGTAISCGGGGGGGYAKKLIQITDQVRAATKTIVVGAGGVGTNASGPAGSDSSYTDGVNTLTGGGGGGGVLGAPNTGSVASAGGAIGTSSGGDINLKGHLGTYGISQGSGVGQAASSSMSWGGPGGAAGMGGGGGPGARYNTNSGLNSGAGGNASSYGGGGGGAAGTNAYASFQNGGNGYQGVVVITEYSGQPPVAAAVISDAPSDGGEYTRVNGIWRLARQAFPVLSVSGAMFPVPVGAKHCRIGGRVYAATAPMNPGIRMSLDGSTFINGASDYVYGGSALYTGSSTSPTKVVPAVVSYIPISGSTDQTNTPIMFSVELVVARPTTGQYSSSSRAWGYNSAASIGFYDSLYSGYNNGGAIGAADRIAALQVFPAGGTFDTTRSLVTVDWYY